MTRALVTIAALWLYGWCWRKHGWRTATLGACMIVMMIYPFAYTGMILPPLLRLFGLHAPAMSVQIVAGVMAIVGAMIAAKYRGWGKVLGGIFMAVLVVSSFVILGLLLVLVLVAAGGH